MLMDEPFGAIDPINRERLQNEFLRLQRQIKKTIVFVTHDIDEAIKMGDRIAILKKGGKLAQYATPADLLTYPADGFVEDFVGADRALKRLSLQRVRRHRPLERGNGARRQSRSTTAREKLGEADLQIPLLVDDADRPLGWLSDRALAGERVAGGAPLARRAGGRDRRHPARRPLGPAPHGTQYAPVVDERGAVAGVLSLEMIGRFLTIDGDAGAPDDPAGIAGEPGLDGEASR